MQLTISQAATLLGTSEGMLERWAHQGVIPSTDVSGVIYFQEQDLAQWAARRHIPLRRNQPSPDAETLPHASIAEAMQRGGVYYNVAGDDTFSVLTSLVGGLELPGIDKALLLSRMLERESLSSTGIGNGIAIPHPRQPLESLAASAVVTCFPAVPVEFNAIDAKPVEVIFLVLSQTTQTHLKLLSQLSFVLNQPGNRELFCSAPEASIVFETVRKHSQTLVE